VSFFTFLKNHPASYTRFTMKFLSTAQEKATQAALRRSYKAVAFDIDGTLTPFGRWTIPESLRETLLAIPPTIPLAFCSGRSLDHVQGKLTSICGETENPESQLKRWYILAENGGAAYEYKPRKHTHETFFEIPWPSQHITQDAMEAFIKDKYGWHVIIMIRDHSMVIRYPDWIYLFPRATRILSRHIAKSLRKLFEKMGLDGDFLVEDSGIGNLIIPKESGKGKVIKVWAKHLGIAVEDILVIGDQAKKGENDEEFLSGRYGTAFTVGHQTKNLHPFPVVDEKGRKVWGPKGTEYLLKKLFILPAARSK